MEELFKNFSTIIFLLWAFQFCILLLYFKVARWEESSIDFRFCKKELA